MTTSIAIIGAGPGGEAAAKRAAAKGFRTTLIEKRDLGGLCLNRGCIPSKTLLEAGRLLSRLKVSDYLEGRDAVRIRWESLQKKKTEVVSGLRSALEQNYSRLGVRVLRGEARFLDEKTLSVRTGPAEERVSFDAAVLATGSEPVFPPPFDAIRNDVLDSDRMLELPGVPDSLTVVGGGAVGCEFACLLNELGCLVTIVERTPALLPGEDPAVVRLLRTSFEKRGIRVLTDVNAVRVERTPAGWKIEFADGASIESAQLLVCAGRRPAVDELGLEAAGVRLERHRVIVNERLQTSNPRIYSVGDVNGLSLLAHAAAAQGEAAVDRIAGEDAPYPAALVPRCLYTWPEVASVGEWIHSAELKGLEVKSKRFFFQGSAKALAGSEPEGFIQVVIEKGSDRLLGAQIIGAHATELIHVFSVALRAGLTAGQLRGVIYAHPTLSEGVKEALSR
jgi:dihydrolipoamide dehydrogenase